MTDTDFQVLEISQNLIKGLRKAGLKEMTPIQRQAIPVLLRGRDVIGQAQTGTGKTAAFGIPLLAKIDPNKPVIQAVVLAPTRELSTQISIMLRNYGKYMDIKIVCVHGGGNIHRQMRLLSRPTHVLVATPGRLCDLLRRKLVLDFKDVKVAVIDEADKILEMGFMDDMGSILSQLPFVRQTSLWSATMLEEVVKLSTRYMRNPMKIFVSKDEIAQTLVHQYYLNVNNENRDTQLYRLLDTLDIDRALIFCNTRNTVEYLVKKLEEEGYLVQGIHGRYTQRQRDVAVIKLRKRQVRYLVTTDVSSRGLDIRGITHIINYQVPEDAEVYFHRIGRTARMGEEGTSITLVSPMEEKYIQDIKQMTDTILQKWKPHLI